MNWCRKKTWKWQPLEVLWDRRPSTTPHSFPRLFPESSVRLCGAQLTTVSHADSGNCPCATECLYLIKILKKLLLYI